MKIFPLFRRMREENQWKRDFMECAIRGGLSLKAAEKLAGSGRATQLREDGLKAKDAWFGFEMQQPLVE